MAWARREQGGGAMEGTIMAMGGAMGGAMALARKEQGGGVMEGTIRATGGAMVLERTIRGKAMGEAVGGVMGLARTSKGEEPRGGAKGGTAASALIDAAVAVGKAVTGAGRGHALVVAVATATEPAVLAQTVERRVHRVAARRQICDRNGRETSFLRNRFFD